MKSTKNYVIATITTLLSVPVALATYSVSTDAANNYFDANWALFTTNGQPHQPAVKELTDMPSMYLDANWAVINTDGRLSEQTSERINRNNREQ